MPNKFPYKIVEVAWLDSEQNASWEKLSDILEDQGTLNCRSVGYLIANKEDRIILASSMSSDEEYEEHVSHYITIPKAAIITLRELRKK